jgi:MFS family permease
MECRDPRAFALLCAAMFFVYSDQNLMAPNLSQIADFFGYDDDERDAKLGGQISVAFFLLGLPATLIIGLLCDVVQRKKVLVATLLLGQGPCLLTIFVTEYWQLFVLRTLTGIAVGGALPLVYSIAGDLFPPTSRAYASAMVGICSSLGSMCGQGVAGFMGPTFGWRLPFAAVAAPGLVVAWLVHAFAEEPARGVAEGKADEEDGDDESGGKAAYAETSTAAVDDATKTKTKTSDEPYDENISRVTFLTRLALDFARKSRSVISRRTNVLGFLQGVPGCVPWSIISVFMNDYLANDKGLGVEAATSLLMCFGLGAMGGTVGGGVVGQRLYNASPVYATTFMGAAAVAGIFPWLFLVHADDYDGNDASAMSRKCAVAIFAGLLCSVTGVNVRAMTVNVNDPRERGTAFAWFNLTDDLGKGFGPVLIAYLIHRMGRQKAFELGFWFWVPCGVLCALCGLTVPKDEARVRREAESLRRGYSVGGEGETASLLGKGGDKMV